MSGQTSLGASFRDPAGFVFREDGLVKRAVTEYGRADYDLLVSSGLYETLSKQNKLISHDAAAPQSSALYKILLPQQITPITYPYEWCFSQLKDAAILTLELELEALAHGMSLKDATPFNVQFLNGKAVFIDTLSFEKYEDKPWVAYKQFCEFFLAPLALMAHVRPDFNRYLSTDLNGIALGFASRLLPRRTWFDFGLLSHIHLHAASQAKYDNAAVTDGKTKEKISGLRLSKNTRVSLVQNLLSVVRGLKLPKGKSGFGEYYESCGHYSREADQFKQNKVEAWGRSQRISLLLDLGGNNGKFSRLFTKKGIKVICADSDIYCVEENYRISQNEQDANMLPLLADVSNPSASVGWMNRERASLAERVRPDAVLALALVHHLRISANVPMPLLAEFFALWKAPLAIEFVPKSDIKVQELLATRKDTFLDYTEESFEKEFSRFFSTQEKTPIPGTQRTLYCLKPKS